MGATSVPLKMKIIFQSSVMMMTLTSQSVHLKWSKSKLQQTSQMIACRAFRFGLMEKKMDRLLAPLSQLIFIKICF